MLKLFLSFFKIGAFTFGGGYAMIPIIQDEIVKKQKLVSEEEFLDYLSIAQSYPGVLAANISILLGYKINKIPGVLVCVLGSVLPSFFIVLLLSFFYLNHSSSKILEGFFTGVNPVVIALIVFSFIKLLEKLPKSKRNIVFIVAATVAVSIFNISPIYIILLGGAYSLCLK